MKYANVTTERERLASVRAARADLMCRPVLPLTPLPARVIGQCCGCDTAIMTLAPGAAFADAESWLWCADCAASDVIGAAFTPEEVSVLAHKLGHAADDGYGSNAVSAEAEGLRAALVSAAGAGPVPVSALFG